MPSRRASRLVRSVRRVVRLIVLPIRPVGSFRLSSRFAPFRPAVRSFSFRLSWRSCRAFSCRLVFFPWHPVSLLRLVHRLVGSSRPRPVISFLSHPWVSRIRSRAWFPCSRRSVLLVARSCSPIRSRFMSPVVGRGCASWPWGGRWLALLISSVPSWFHARYSLTRCGMAAGGCGYEAPFRPAVRSSLASHGSSFFSSHRFLSPSLCSLIPSSTKQENGDGDGDGEGEGGWRRQTREKNETHKRDETTRSPTRRGGLRRYRWEASNETDDKTQ